MVYVNEQMHKQEVILVLEGADMTALSGGNELSEKRAVSGCTHIHVRAHKHRELESSLSVNLLSH
jgi:hypothetical protein